MTDEEFTMTDFGGYTKEQFFDDVCRCQTYRTDYDLASIMTNKSYETMQWLLNHNVKWIPIYGRQAYKIDGKFKFWGGMVIEAVGGGKGLVDAFIMKPIRLGITIHYNTAAIDLVTEQRKVLRNYRPQQEKNVILIVKRLYWQAAAFMRMWKCERNI